LEVPVKLSEELIADRKKILELEHEVYKLKVALIEKAGWTKIYPDVEVWEITVPLKYWGRSVASVQDAFQMQSCLMMDLDYLNLKDREPTP